MVHARAKNWRQLTAGFVALMLAVGGLSLTFGASGSTSAAASELEEAQAARDAAQAEIDELEAELEGIDSELAELLLQVEEAEADLPVLEAQVEDSNAQLAAAERYYAQVQDQLAAAEAEKETLDAQVAESEEEEAELAVAVGEMARGIYRGGTTSTTELLMSAEGTGDVSERAAAVQALSRAQSQALDQVRSSLVVQQNQAEAQAAVVERISALKEEAETAYQGAEAAKEAADTAYAELESHITELEELQAEWESRRSDAEAQLEVAEQERQEALELIAEIDEENRKNQVVYSSSTSSLSSGAVFTLPVRVSTYITSSFGWRLHPVTGVYKLHNGTDYAVSCGVPQYAARSGVVSAVTVETSGGNVVYVNHGMVNGSSWVTAYAHLQSAAVSVGQTVDTNTVIGYTGATGYATGCHMHFTVMKNGSEVDPTNYM